MFLDIKSSALTDVDGTVAFCETKSEAVLLDIGMETVLTFCESCRRSFGIDWQTDATKLWRKCQKAASKKARSAVHAGHWSGSSFGEELFNAAKNLPEFSLIDDLGSSSTAELGVDDDLDEIKTSDPKKKPKRRRRSKTKKDGGGGTTPLAEKTSLQDVVPEEAAEELEEEEPPVPEEEEQNMVVEEPSDEEDIVADGYYVAEETKECPPEEEEEEDDDEYDALSEKESKKNDASIITEEEEEDVKDESVNELQSELRLLKWQLAQQAEKHEVEIRELRLAKYELHRSSSHGEATLIQARVRTLKAAKTFQKLQWAATVCATLCRGRRCVKDFRLTLKTKKHMMAFRIQKQCRRVLVRIDAATKIQTLARTALATRCDRLTFRTKQTWRLKKQLNNSKTTTTTTVPPPRSSSWADDDDDDDDEEITQKCPLSKEAISSGMMLLVDGVTYEARFIKEWVDKHGTSPVTSAPASERDMVPRERLVTAFEAADALKSIAASATVDAIKKGDFRNVGPVLTVCGADADGLGIAAALFDAASTKMAGDDVVAKIVYQLQRGPRALALPLIQVIAALAKLDAGKVHAAEKNCFPAVIKLLVSGNAAVKEVAVTTLAHFARGLGPDEFRAAVLASPSGPRLTSKDRDLLEAQLGELPWWSDLQNDEKRSRPSKKSRARRNSDDSASPRRWGRKTTKA